ncbi:MAG: alpha/beta hydrolase [Renibacterium salmoninarum]|nr:alpha/beta hydrolase [Renibacterium salmoninarum]
MRESTLQTDDGGHLALYSYGTEDAPGGQRVVVVGGAFLTALIYRPFSIAFAKTLGEGWAVDVYDRRGRGGSSEQPEDYSIRTEISDLALVLRETRAKNILGHSLGGSVALNSVQEFVGSELEPEKLALYDPAINIDNSLDMSWFESFENDVAAGRISHAWAKFKRGFNATGPLTRVPEPILAGLLALVAPTRAARAVKALLPTAVGELKAGMLEAEKAEDFSKLPAGTQFLVGAKSPEYFHETAKRLHAAIPGSGFALSPKMVHGSIPAAARELLDELTDYFRS